MLTTSELTHLSDAARLEEFCRRQQSRLASALDRRVVSYRRRVKKLEPRRDDYDLITRGGRQPMATGAYGKRIAENES